MNSVKIGDRVLFVLPASATLPNGAAREVVVTDVIRCIFSREPMALEFTGRDGTPAQFEMRFFRSL